MTESRGCRGWGSVLLHQRVKARKGGQRAILSYLRRRLSAANQTIGWKIDLYDTETTAKTNKKGEEEEEDMGANKQVAPGKKRGANWHKRRGLLHRNTVNAEKWMVVALVARCRYWQLSKLNKKNKVTGAETRNAGDEGSLRMTVVVWRRKIRRCDEWRINVQNECGERNVCAALARKGKSESCTV